MFPGRHDLGPVRQIPHSPHEALAFSSFHRAGVCRRALLFYSGAPALTPANIAKMGMFPRGSAGSGRPTPDPCCNPCKLESPISKALSLVA